MTCRATYLTIAGVTALLVTPWAVAWACFCPAYESEQRFYAVSSITQLDGSGDHVDAELLRWGGETRLTVDTPPATSSVALWLRVHVGDGQVRNVRIDGVAPVAGDTGGAR